MGLKNTKCVSRPEWNGRRFRLVLPKKGSMLLVSVAHFSMLLFQMSLMSLFTMVPLWNISYRMNCMRNSSYWYKPNCYAELPQLYYCFIQFWWHLGFITQHLSCAVFVSASLISNVIKSINVIKTRVIVPTTAMLGLLLGHVPSY